MENRGIEWRQSIIHWDKSKIKIGRGNRHRKYSGIISGYRDFRNMHRDQVIGSSRDRDRDRDREEIGINIQKQTNLTK